MKKDEQIKAIFHAIDSALFYQNMEVLAIELSKASRLVPELSPAQKHYYDYLVRLTEGEYAKVLDVKDSDYE